MNSHLLDASLAVFLMRSGREHEGLSRDGRRVRRAAPHRLETQKVVVHVLVLEASQQGILLLGGGEGLVNLHVALPPAHHVTLPARPRPEVFGNCRGRSSSPF